MKGRVDTRRGIQVQLKRGQMVAGLTSTYIRYGIQAMHSAVLGEIYSNVCNHSCLPGMVDVITWTPSCCCHLGNVPGLGCGVVGVDQLYTWRHTDFKVGGLEKEKSNGERNQEGPGISLGRSRSRNTRGGGGERQMRRLQRSV